MNGYEWYIFWPCLSFLSFLFLCPEWLSRWMLRSTKRSFENGPRSLKKLELKLIQISADSPAEFDTSTQALTNSNQQSLNLNLSKHLNSLVTTPSFTNLSIAFLPIFPCFSESHAELAVPRTGLKRILDQNWKWHHLWHRRTALFFCSRDICPLTTTVESVYLEL